MRTSYVWLMDNFIVEYWFFQYGTSCMICDKLEDVAFVRVVFYYWMYYMDR